jgi:hypothetical protein
MQPRFDLAKCEGNNSDCCEQCTRKLSPASPGQKWAAPIYNKDGQCALFANVEKYGHLYGMTKREIVKVVSVAKGKK